MTLLPKRFVTTSFVSYLSITITYYYLVSLQKMRKSVNPNVKASAKKSQKQNKEDSRLHYFQRKSKKSGNLSNLNDDNTKTKYKSNSKFNSYGKNKNKNKNKYKNNNKNKSKKNNRGSKNKNKSKNKAKDDKKNNASKNNKNWLLTENVPIETLTSDQQSVVFRKIFLETLKMSMLESDFKFNATHFHALTQKNNSSVDTMHSFLIDHYATENSSPNETTNGTKEKEKEKSDHSNDKGKECKDDNSKVQGSSNIEDQKKESKEQKEEKKAEWIPYTKTMQCLVIASSVQRAVEFVKGLRDINVKHCFLHKKQVKKMEYFEEEVNYDENEGIIRLRICELFGKHRKLKDQILDLDSKSWHIGVGGSNRILKLCDLKHLTMKKCQYIFIDCQRNAKQMCIFDMKQIATDCCNLIQKYGLDRLKKGKLKIICI